MNHVHMPKKEASLKVAANTPITASCNATANLDKINVVSECFCDYVFRSSNV